MAIFDSFTGKKTEKTAVPRAPKTKRAEHTGTVRIGGTHSTGDHPVASVLRNPRITEKASFITEDGAYTFDVLPQATKRDIARAMQEVYGVTPVKVRTVTMPSKNVYSRGRRGVKSGGKKAIVYLKKGERIEFI